MNEKLIGTITEINENDPTLNTVGAVEAQERIAAAQAQAAVEAGREAQAELRNKSITRDLACAARLSSQEGGHMVPTGSPDYHNPYASDDDISPVDEGYGGFGISSRR